MRTITPNRRKTEKRAQREALADLHARAARIRSLRASGRVLDAEDAEGETDMFRHWAQHLRAQIRATSTAVVLKGSAWSENAARRRLTPSAG